MEAVEIRAGDLRLRPWRPADVPAVERACPDPGLRPWAAEARHFVTELAPAMLADVAEPVRRQAHVFGRERPTVPAGAVTLRPPADRDRRATVTAYTDPEIVRWFGVLDPYFDADARRYIQRDAPQEWARGTEAIFVVAGPGDTYAGSVDLRISAHDPAAGEIGRRVAEKAGFTMEGRLRSGHAKNGIRRDCWIASLPAVDAAGGGGAGSTDPASADRVTA